MNRIFRLLTWAVLFASTSICIGGTIMSLQPNSDIQSFLGSMLTTNENEMFAGDEGTFRLHLSRLREIAGNDEAYLVCQLLHFSSRATEMQEAMLPGVILNELNINTSTIADGALALIGTDDPSLRVVVYNWLGGTDITEDGEVDYSRYETILKSMPLSHVHTNGLVRYMYDRDPLAAVTAMARIYGDVSDLTELVMGLQGKQKTTLQLLANRDEWWARLYVAEIMKKNIHLHDPTILEQLGRDKHPFVREEAGKAIYDN